ncbi:hypothetical protein KCMC57_up47700 [Kitasatospora sp. CMC57]|uniref:Flavodoxin-like fold domain-containing protein n=1 Tax=Kitasatospora sp. CMC57 TaxID=3231513 RepID=A0AB33K6M2_9ACTN
MTTAMPIRIGVYLAHPRIGSFNQALYHAVVDELRGRGCEVLARDLYAEDFAFARLAEETGTVADAADTSDPHLALHRAEVATLDALVLIHLNWWGMPPPSWPTGCSGSSSPGWPTNSAPPTENPPTCSKQAEPWY